MTTQTFATPKQLTAIRARAVNSVTRAIMQTGIRLSYAQAEALGEEAMHWLRSRLDLDVTTTDTGIVAVPQHGSAYAIVNARGEIVSLHADRVSEEQGWGFDHELVELTRAHRVGDRIEWDQHGREC